MRIPCNTLKPLLSDIADVKEFGIGQEPSKYDRSITNNVILPGTETGFRKRAKEMFKQVK